MKKWFNDLSAQFFPLQFVDPSGKLVNGSVQLSVREVKLIELAFPEECEAEVMGLIRPAPRWTKSFEKIAKPFKLFARLLGLKKPLEQNKWVTNPHKYVYNEWIHATALGTKKDEMRPLIEKEAKREEQI